MSDNYRRVAQALRAAENCLNVSREIIFLCQVDRYAYACDTNIIRIHFRVKNVEFKTENGTIK